MNNLFGTFETSYNGICYRPVLELPTDLAADSLKVVKVAPGVNMADDGGYKSWVDIIVKKARASKLPPQKGCPDRMASLRTHRCGGKTKTETTTSPAIPFRQMFQRFTLYGEASACF